MSEKWIKKAKLKKGALTDWVKRVVGETGFTKDGKIKREILFRIKEGKKISGVTPSKLTIKRANLALTLKKLVKGKKK